MKKSYLKTKAPGFKEKTDELHTTQKLLVISILLDLILIHPCSRIRDLNNPLEYSSFIALSMFSLLIGMNFTHHLSIIISLINNNQIHRHNN